MLRPDIQAEIILSFQEEKRQQLMQVREQQRALAVLQPSRRTRFLRAGGRALITAGYALQRMAGTPMAGDVDRRPLGEAF